jgi:SET domain
LQIPDKKVLNMYKVVPSDDEDDAFVRESNTVIGQQLLLNYCFGHKDSSMVLYPSGSVVNLINHGDKPNAKLVWSTHASHQKVWLDFEPSKLLEEENRYIGLLMEIVATRDIKESEEILLDYGAAWKAAWAAHVKAFDAKLKSGTIPRTWPLRAIDLNDEYRKKPFKTEAEDKEHPYPENVMLKAYLMIEDSESAGTLEDPKNWLTSDPQKKFDAASLFDFVVVARTSAVADDTEPFRYTIRWANNNGDFTFVKNVPHSAIAFVDKPGTSDQFVEEPFRHMIGIPDEIFPKAWKNLV